MKKFLLVTFIGIVLAINLYGIVSTIVTNMLEAVGHIEETTITVYME